MNRRQPSNGPAARRAGASAPLPPEPPSPSAGRAALPSGQPALRGAPPVPPRAWETGADGAAAGAGRGRGGGGRVPGVPEVRGRLHRDGTALSFRGLRIMLRPSLVCHGLTWPRGRSPSPLGWGWGVGRRHSPGDGGAGAWGVVHRLFLLPLLGVGWGGQAPYPLGWRWRVLVEEAGVTLLGEHFNKAEIPFYERINVNPWRGWFGASR